MESTGFTPSEEGNERFYTIGWVFETHFEHVRHFEQKAPVRSPLRTIEHVRTFECSKTFERGIAVRSELGAVDG